MSDIHGPPVVLVIAGNDPSGGAGLAADIQALTAAGVHPAPVVAALTVQDSRNVRRVQAMDAQLVAEQAQTVLQDLPVSAIKLGLLAEAAVGHAVALLLRQHAEVPVVIDPVLAASGGRVLAAEDLLETYLQDLFPLATLITPNAAESRRFAPQAADVATRGQALLATGARAVLIKGADEETPEVHNFLFADSCPPREFTWPRLAGHYHGSGCTLAAAAAAHLARGMSLPEAVQEAQRYTWDALQRGFRPGKGQHFPNRMPQ